MITNSDRRARCTREDQQVRRQDKDRVRARSGAREILREIVENQAVDKVRHEEDNTGDTEVGTSSKP